MSIIANKVLEQNRVLLLDCYKHWGKDAQMRMVIEEMSELTKEICKELRGNDV